MHCLVQCFLKCSFATPWYALTVQCRGAMQCFSQWPSRGKCIWTKCTAAFYVTHESWSKASSALLPGITWWIRVALQFVKVLPDQSGTTVCQLSRYYLMDQRSTVVCQGGWKLDWQMTSQLLCSSSYCRAASVECGTHTTYVSLQSTYQRITDTVNAAIPSLTMHKEMNSSRSAGEMCMLTCAVCVMCVLPVLCVLCVCFYGWFCVCMCAKRSTGACLW